MPRRSIYVPLTSKKQTLAVDLFNGVELVLPQSCTPAVEKMNTK